MKYFDNKILKIDEQIKKLLALIITEAQEAFISPLNKPELNKLEKKPNSKIGCEQLIKIYLEQILIYLIRKGQSITSEMKIYSSVKERSDGDLVKKTINYLEENIYNDISFDTVCNYLFLSRTRLKVLFKEQTGISVMEYFRKLKIAEAKKMIREGGS